jgi:repressor LexA
MTPRQHELMNFIREHIAAKGYSPSYEEMAAALGVKSRGHIANMVACMVERRHLRREKQAGRRAVVVAGESEFERGYRACIKDFGIQIATPLAATPSQTAAQFSSQRGALRPSVENSPNSRRPSFIQREAP